MTVVLNVLGGTITGPVMPKLLHSLTGGSMAQMSTVYGVMATLFAGMQLFAGPIQGALSDRFGRRPVILGSTLGLCITSVLMALAPSIGWLFAANIIWGAAAGSLTAAFAYVADVTDPDQRAQRFGLLTAAVSAGGAAGPVIGGFMGEFDARAPFWMAAGLGGISLLYGFFVLPESLPRALRVPLAWRSMHPVGVIRNIWRDHPILKSWQLATFLTSLGTAGINSIGVLYMAFRFGWTPRTIGFYAAFMGVTSIVVQAGLVAKTIRVLGERRALLGGIVVQTIAIGTAGFALMGWEFSAAMFFVVLGSVAEPARLAILNRIINASERGRLSGANRSIISLTGLIAPGLFAVMFASVVGAGPNATRVGTPFFACTALMIAGLAITFWSVNRLPNQSAPR